MPPFKLIIRTRIAGPLDPASDIEQFDRMTTRCSRHTCDDVDIALHERGIGQPSHASLVRWLREGESPLRGKLGEFVAVVALVFPRLVATGCHSPNDESADQGDDDLLGQTNSKGLGEEETANE